MRGIGIRGAGMIPIAMQGGGQGGGVPAFSDTFERADGDLANGWTYTAGLWTISGGSALGTPGFTGGEILANPGFEGVYVDESGGLGGTVNVAPDWDQKSCERTGGETLDAEAVIVHGGAESQKMFLDNGSEGIITTGNVMVAADVGKWFQAYAWLYGVVGSVLITTVGNALVRTLTPTAGVWTQYFLAGRHLTAVTRQHQILSANSPCQFYVDDASFKQLTTVDLFCTRDILDANRNITVPLTMTPGTQAGIVGCLDSAVTPANFLLAYHNGTNAVLDECVGGAYANLISSAAAYGDGRNLTLIKSGTNAYLYYNGVQIGATIDITGKAYLNNTRHGMFTTYTGNRIASFVANPANP